MNLLALFRRRAPAPPAPPLVPYVPQPSIDAVLQALFGAPADQIHITSLTDLACTLDAGDVELLLRAAGPPWTHILFRVAANRAARLLTKDPGADPRFSLQKAPGA